MTGALAKVLVLSGFLYFLAKLLSRRELKLSPKAYRSLSWAFGLGLGLWLLAVSLLRVKLGLTRAYDLGNAEHLVYLISRGNFSAAFIGHARPALALFAPLFWLKPSGVLLILAQSLALGAGAWLAWIVGKESFGEEGGFFGLALYLLYPPLQRGWLFDFHPDCLFPIFGFLGVLGVWRRKGWLVLLAGAGMALVKEYGGIFAAGLGLYALLRGRRLAGLTLLLVGPLWFLLAKNLVLTRYTYSSAFSLANLPSLAPQKLEFYFNALAPFLGLPLATPEAIPAALGLLPTAFTNLPNYASIYFHYLLPVVPFLVAGALVFLKARPRWRWSVLASAALFSALEGITPFSWEVWFKRRSDYHISKMLAAPFREDTLSRLAGFVPRGASLSYTNDSWRPGIAARESLWVFPRGLGEAQFVLLNLSEPWRWFKPQGVLEYGVDPALLYEDPERAIPGYEVVAREGPYWLLRRRERQNIRKQEGKTWGKRLDRDKGEVCRIGGDMLTKTPSGVIAGSLATGGALIGAYLGGPVGALLGTTIGGSGNRGAYGSFDDDDSW